MRRSVLVGGFVIALFTLLPIAASAQQAGEVIPNRLVVTFRSGPAPAEAVADGLVRAHGAKVRQVFRHSVRGMVIEVNPKAAPRVLAALRRDPRVRSAGFDRYASAVAQTVPRGINRINAEPGVGANTGSGIRVAIVDTGLDFNHPDLQANIDTSLSVNCINGNGSCSPGGQDDEAHGTFVGGIVAAVNNTSQLVGASSQATLIAVKVLNSSGSGSFGDISAAMDYLTGLNVAGTKIDVANMSLGARCSVCTDDSTDPTIAAFHDAVRGLVDSGTTVVVASGNDGTNASTSVPASFDEVVTVSAIADTDGQPGGNGPALLILGMGRVKDDSYAKFANSGADIDVTGPGVNETSLGLGGGTSSGSGTSFSSPHAAAVAAIFIRDRLNKGEPRPTPAVVRQALIETGECYQNGGSGTTFHGTFGCNTVWPGDPDGLPEPLVRADNIKNFAGSSQPPHDGAVTSVSAASPVAVDSTNEVLVGVSNLGSTTETITVTLGSSLDSSFDDSSEGVLLASGASTTLTFLWTPNIGGSHALTASASVADDSNSSNNSKSTTVSVTDGASGSISLAVTAYKVKGLQKADLAWSGATSPNVDVYRNGGKIATTGNDGAYTDNINNKGGGSYNYRVCEQGTTICSDDAVASF